VYPKFPDWPPGARTANDKVLCQYVQLYRHSASHSSAAAITLCVAPQRVFIVVVIVDFIIDSVQKFLDTPVFYQWRSHVKRVKSIISTKID
jgi:hypothetical protein